MRYAFAFGFFVLGALCAPAETPKGVLVVDGGGKVTTGLYRKILDLAGGTNVTVLVIPFATASTNSGDASLNAWRRSGAARVSALTAQDREAALAAVQAADVIWLGGGSQSRLMAGLQRLNLVEAIRERYAQGAVIGGSSAGAAVMSKVMIAGPPKTPDAPPPMAEGLGLWPEVIVDMHFVKRVREPRLRKAVAAHPDLVGVGIDESTCVIVRGHSAEVFGKGTVTLLDTREGKAEAKVSVLKASESFDLPSITSN